MKAVLIAMWRLFHALLFYPLLIVLFLWLYWIGAHWIFGLLVLLAILIVDPIWRRLGQGVIDLFRKDRRGK